MFKYKSKQEKARQKWLRKFERIKADPKRLKKYREKCRRKSVAKYARIKANPKRYERYLNNTRKGIALWRIRNPLKAKAHQKVFIELRAGRLNKKPCKVCGNQKSEAHHKDYTKFLDVVWLCKLHHVQADAKLKP